MIGVERGWRLRGQASGSRVAGVRTYSLLGAAGGVSALLGEMIPPLATFALVAAPALGLVIGHWRGASRRDAHPLHPASWLRLELHGRRFPRVQEAKSIRPASEPDSGMADPIRALERREGWCIARPFNVYNGLGECLRRTGGWARIARRSHTATLPVRCF
jgi:hypothetical protein